MKLFSPSIALLIAITVFAPLASGQTPNLYYGGSSNSDFDSASSWNLESGQAGTVPGQNDTAIIATGVTYSQGFIFFSGVDTYTITQSAATNQVQGLQFTGFDNAGTVNLSGQSYVVTGRAGDVGTGNVLYGDLNIDGNTTVNFTGPGTITVNKGLIVVGDGIFNGNTTNDPGNGTFNITAGAFTFDPGSGSTTEMDVGAGTGFFTNSATGTVSQGITGVSSSIVTTGNILNIGYNGGTGKWTLNNNSVLQTGTQAGVSYVIAIGANSTDTGFFGNSAGSSFGTLTIADSSTFTVNSGGDLQLGTAATGAAAGVGGGNGTVIQSGANSVVNFLGNSSVEVGTTAGGVGTYDMEKGTLNIGTGTTDSVTFVLGKAAANILDGLTASSGTLLQSGGTMTVGSSLAANGTTFTVGGAVGAAGTGNYTITGGTAIFNNALTIGATGSVVLGSNVTNGVLTSAGTLVISNTNLTAGAGSFTFAGGTLDLTTATVGLHYTFPYANASTLSAGTVSTIDLTQGTGTFATFALAQNLSGAGGINFVGTAGTTVFTMTGTTAYTGSTTITSGELDATVDQLTQSSSLGIGATGVLVLTLDPAGPGVANSVGSIVGAAGGMLNVNFDPTNTTLELKGLANNYGGTITLGKNGVAGTLQVFNGTLGAIDVGAGAEMSNLIVGGDTTVATGGTVTVGSTTFTGQTTVFGGFTLNATNLNGNVVNSGTLNVATNIGTVPGNTVMNSGTLTAGTITGTVTNNGGATLTVTGAGITGAVNNTGTLTAANISLTLANNAGGTFIATNADNATTVGGNVTNAGTLTPTAPLVAVPVGNTPNATFTVGGTLVESAGSVMNERVSNGVADLYQLGPGASTLTGILAAKGSTAIGRNIFLVVNDVGGTVDSTTLTTGEESALFSATIDRTLTTDTQVFIDTVQKPVATYAQTPNQIAVANSIDSSGSNPIKNVFSTRFPSRPHRAISPTHLSS